MGAETTGASGATTPSPAADTRERRAFLGAVEQRLDVVVHVDPHLGDPHTETLIAAARHLVLAGGKRARPWLTMLLGEVFAVPSSSLRDLAVCVELIHAASLLHDDVVDAGTRRRGRPTANALWGNLEAVLSGDLLLTLALEQLRPHPSPVHHAAVDTVAAMTRATLHEAAARGRVDLTLEQWIRIAEGKTGALFALCGRGVGLLADEPVGAERLAEAASALGLAFQVADDLDDLLGRGAGKDAFADLRNRNPNCAVAMAVESSAALGRDLEAAWADPTTDPAQFARLGQAVLDSGAAERAWALIGDRVTAAERGVAPWREEPAIELVCGWARRMWRRAEPGREATCAVS